MNKKLVSASDGAGSSGNGNDMPKPIDFVPTPLPVLLWPSQNFLVLLSLLKPLHTFILTYGKSLANELSL
jgi:hypothetical protein